MDVAQGVRALAMKSLLTSKMDKGGGISHSQYPYAQEGSSVAGLSPNNPGEVPPPSSNREGSTYGNKIKDKGKMMSLLERERERLNGAKKDKHVRYDLEKAPFEIERERQEMIMTAAKSSTSPGNSMNASFRMDQTSFNNQGMMTGGFPMHISPERENYANFYGKRPERLPYEDEVDMLNEHDKRYQELNHWYSTLEKPNEDNLEVLKKLNHDRLDTLASQLRRQRSHSKDLHQLNSIPAYNGDFIKHSVVQSKRSRKPSPSKEEYTSEFAKYMKEKRQKQLQSTGQFEYMVDFDRYECTSPDPKRRGKEYTLLYKENIRVDPSGITEQEMEQIKIDSDPTYVPMKIRKAQKAKEERIAAKNSIPPDVLDEDRVIYWIWGKVNPLYRPLVSKQQVLNFMRGNPEILQVFGLHPSEYERVLESMITENHGNMNFDEFDVGFD